MAKIAQAVGLGRPNRSADVMTVQVLLNRCLHSLAPAKPLIADGKFGAATQAAIERFQQRAMKASAPDGIVAPTGPTLRAMTTLAEMHLPNTVDPTAGPSNLGGLSEAQYVDAAKQLQCEAAVIKAVVLTELGIRGPFDEPIRRSQVGDFLSGRIPFDGFAGTDGQIAQQHELRQRRGVIKV